MRTLLLLIAVCALSAALLLAAGTAPGTDAPCPTSSWSAAPAPESAQRSPPPPPRRTPVVPLAPAMPEPTATLAGTVVDASGRPVTDVPVLAMAAATVVDRTRTDGRGRFVFSHAGAPPPVRLVVPATAGFDTATTHTHLWGAGAITLTLFPAGSLTVTVAAADGAPVEEFGLAWSYRDVHGAWRAPGRQWARRHPGGRTVVDEVPAGPVRVVVLPRGGRCVANEPLEFVKPAGDFEVHVRLDRQVPLSVTVLDAHWRPVADTQVELLRSLDDAPVPGDAELIDSGPLGGTPSGRPCAVQLATAVTDGTGHATLAWHPPDAQQFLRVRTPDGPTPCVAMPVRSHPAPLTFVLGAEQAAPPLLFHGPIAAACAGRADRPPAAAAASTSRR